MWMGWKETGSPPPENLFRVYVVRENGDGPGSYVGSAKYTVEDRLKEHNLCKGKGAQATKGRQWQVCAVYKGFKTHQQADKSEKTLMAPRNAVRHWSERHAVALSLIRDQKQHRFVHEDPAYPRHILIGHLDEVAEPSANKARYTILDD